MPEKCPDPCPAVTRLERQIEDLKDSNSMSHEKIYDRLRELEKSDAVQRSEYNSIMDMLKNLTKKVDAIEAKPAKRWDGLVDKVICTLTGAVITYILARMGLI